MKTRIAKLSLGVALLLFLIGFMVLCYCPEWYALAAGFAAVTAWLGAARLRAWGIVLVAASLALTAFHLYAKMEEAEKIRKIRRRIEEEQRLEQRHSLNRQTFRDARSTSDAVAATRLLSISNGFSTVL